MRDFLALKRGMAGMLGKGKVKCKNEKESKLVLLKVSQKLYHYYMNNELGEMHEEPIFEKPRPNEWISIAMDTACAISACGHYQWRQGKRRQWIIIGTTTARMAAILMFDFIHHEVQKFQLHQLPVKLNKSERRQFRVKARMALAYRLSNSVDQIMRPMKKQDPIYQILDAQRKATKEWIKRIKS
jgi:hypothetical protein